MLLRATSEGDPCHDRIRQEANSLRTAFEKLDVDKDGAITVTEMQQVLTKEGFATSGVYVDGIMEGLDACLDGMVQYQDFLAAILGSTLVTDEAILTRFFETLDLDAKGYLSMVSSPSTTSSCQAFEHILSNKYAK